MKIITRQFIISRIDSLLQGEVSVPAFGEEMVAYLAFNDKYKFEPGFEDLLEEVIGEFMDMHDAGKGNVGYEPYIPSHERLIQIKAQLQN